jgi:hypothetical protein
MTLSVALGANLWMVAVIAPLFVGGTLATVPAGGVVSLLLLVIACPTALAWGAYRRAPAILLVGFPFLVALPLLLREATELSLPAPPFFLLGASLAAYLLATARGLERAVAGEGDWPEVKTSALAPERVPPRWRRRSRIYRAISLASLLLPLALLWAVDLRHDAVDAIDRAFGPRADAVRALYTAGAAFLALLVFRYRLVPPLESHLQRDREVVRKLDALRAHARAGRPSLSFYLLVVVALATMAAVVWERTR